MSDLTLQCELRDAEALHLKTVRRRDELLNQVRCLKERGELSEAGELALEAQTIQRWLTALEGTFRLTQRLN